ncbi:hypothetical protein GIB67_023887 [Kingdonia uniflora]|uniref:Uncharacterized protein n=1 Tax=Kingdonia uniflora TaxID=39325 RepID=A0A7J7NG89_9MAGN|nr:hypothetical protein GIB67_023887 [Kingdonia uniflora]
MDRLRLIFPPVGAATICIPLRNIVKLILTPITAPALLEGGLLGYIMYNLTHYYLHRGQPTKEITREMKVRINHFHRNRQIKK